MQKLICTTSLFRFGVKKFQRDVNYWLEQGWTIDEFEVTKQGLRFLCVATLYKDEVCGECCHD